jgi:hypothetical protein
MRVTVGLHLNRDLSVGLDLNLYSLQGTEQDHQQRSFKQKPQANIMFRTALITGRCAVAVRHSSCVCGSLTGHQHGDFTVPQVNFAFERDYWYGYAN